MPAALKHLSELDKISNGVVSVLAHWKADGLYYTVDVLKCDKKDKKCYVQFEDNSQYWVEAKDLHLQLTLDSLKVEDIVCCVCDGGSSKVPNEIIICDTCQQGYHINCHNPPIERENANLEDEEVEWLCATCQHLVNLSDTESQKPSSVSPKPDKYKTPKKTFKSTPKTQKSNTKSNKKTPKTPKPTKKSPSGTKIKLSVRNRTARGTSPSKDAKSSNSPKTSAGSDQPGKMNEMETSLDTTIQTVAESVISDAEKQVALVESTNLVAKIEPILEMPVEVSANETVTVAPNASLNDKKSTNGLTVERMDAVVIEAAKKLSSTEINPATNEFVSLVTGEDPLKTKSSALKSHTKPIPGARGRKGSKISAAAY